MLGVCVPALGVLRGQGLVLDEQHMLGILLLGCLGEVEAPRPDGVPVDDHHLVMRNGVAGIDLRRHPLVGQEIRRRVCVPAAALIQDNLHAHARFWASTKAFAMGAEVKL